MDYVQVIIWAHQVKVGRQCLRWQKLRLNLFQILRCIYSLKGTIRGISYISNRYSKANNNKYLKSYDPKQESKHIIYLDANNLCGYAMSKFLPTSVLKWMDPKEFDLNKHASNSSKKCVLEVDLKYLKELHQLRNNYALAPEKIEIKRQMLFEYQLKIADL